MSTDPPAPPNPRAADTAGTASALAILGATALGSLMGARVNRLPLVLGAGAAALALWRSRENKAPAALPPPPSASPVAPPPAHADVFVQEWLDRQRQADADVPPVPLPPVSDAPESEAAQDIYVPLPLLPDEDAPPPTSQPHIYARLTEPLAASPAEPPLVPSAHWTPPLHTPTAPDHLTFDPLPALSEAADPPVAEPAAAPDLPLYTSAASASLVFQGGDLPDHIEVDSPEAHVAPEQPFAHILPTAPPFEAPVVVPEIAVELASPGEASFDPPLDGLPPSPWQPPIQESQTAPPPEPAPIIADGEIVLRPQAPNQNSITHRAPSAFPRPAKNPTIVDHAETPAAPPAPAAVTAKHRSPPSWNSWWQGD